MALYRKYRPQTFAQLVGQDLIRTVLINALKNKRVGHAYLFAGPRGTGKTSAARLLAKGINCLDESSHDACGKCEHCKSIEQGKYVDLIEIDAASNRGIDEIRELREKVNFAPAEGVRKIYIIDEVHMLTKEAFNALLKTLEEPPDYVTFILATTEAHKVPITILSRVQRFDFKLASQEELSQKLSSILEKEGYTISKDALEKIGQLSGGSFRDSESLLAKILSSDLKKKGKVSLEDIEQGIGLIESQELENFVSFLLAGKSREALDLMENVVQEGYAVDQLVVQTLYLLRNMIRRHFTHGDRVDIRRVMQVIKEISEVGPKLKVAAIPSLPLEIAIFNLSLEKEEDSSTEFGADEGPKTNNESTKKKEKENKDEQNKKKEEDVDIKKMWPKILEKTKVFNHHLYAFLSKAEIGKIEGNTITLDVAYKFHKQKIESEKVKKFMKSVFDEVLGGNYILRCNINPDLVSSFSENDNNDSNEDLVEEVFADL